MSGPGEATQQPPADGARGRLAAVLRGARALIFDFDGTLVDSNPIKWRAFESTFAEFADRLGEIMAYCRGHHHVMRTEKFRHVYERILGRPYTPQIEATLQERFARWTTEEIVAAPEIPGAMAFVRRWSPGRLIGLLSGTPHRTLLEILVKRSWAEEFGALRGAPVSKARWLDGICRQQGLRQSHMVFFGDTAEDEAAAAEAGCGFVAIAAEPSVGGVARVSDFRPLLELL